MKIVFIFLIFSIFSAYIFPMNNTLSKDEPEIKADKIELHRKENFVVFEGNVLFEKEGSIIKADKLIKNENKKIIEITGNIFMDYRVNPNEQLELSANKAVYYTEQKKIELWGNPFLTFKSTSVPETKISSDRIKVLEEDSSSYFEGNVRINSYDKIKNIQTYAYCSHASFNYKINSLILKADKSYNIQPYLEYNNEHNIRFDADEIIILTKENRFIFNGNVRGELKK